MAQLVASHDLFGAAPTLSNVFPAGGQRGTKFTVTCSGSFNWPVKVWSPGIEAVPLPESGKLEVTVPSDLAADRVWIRLYDGEGASSAFPFLVGGLKEINEVEPNNKPGEAQAIAETSVTINGLLKEAEVDCFSVMLSAGQTLVAAVDANTRIGSPMDSILQIVSSNGIVLAENHDDLKLDPRLAFTAPATGPYIIRLFAFPATPDTTIRFNGSANHIYRLTLTTGSYVTHTVPLSAPLNSPEAVSVRGWNLPPDLKLNIVPFGGSRLVDDLEFETFDELLRSPDARIGFAFNVNSTVATRVRLTPQTVIRGDLIRDPKTPLNISTSASVTGGLSHQHPSDEYILPILKNQQIIISVEARSLDLPLDPVLKFTDSTGSVLANVDDSGASRDASFTYKAKSDGDHRLTITDRLGQKGEPRWYLLTVRQDQPHFEISVTQDAIVVNSEKPTEIPVKIQRRGSSTEAVGSIQIEAIDLPEGVSSNVVTSETSGPTSTEVKIQISSTGVPFSGPIKIVGKSTQPKEIKRFARTPARLGVCFERIWLTNLSKPQ